MNIDLNTYRKKVQGCWTGKNIGGTLGAPFEFFRQVNDVSFYTQDLGGDPLPNDDLDLQLLWLIAMEEQGVDIDANTLAEYWCLYVVPHWSEYGISKINMRSGLLPPWSGIHQNKWRHSCGAFIRSEIWACVAPAMPALAVKYAIEDAIVDHGTGEGTWGEVFFAALESAAFIESDLNKLIEIGLSFIPENSGTAQAIKCAINAYESGMSWRDVRDEILRHHRGSTLFGIPERTSIEDREKGFDTGELGYDAPSNVALTVLALLVGGKDFSKVVCTAVNCGEDTDCTAATAGAIYGLIYGVDAIDKKWTEPIGNGIKTISLNLGELGHFGGQVPATTDELSIRTEAMAKKVLGRFADGKVTLGPADPDGPEIKEDFVVFNDNIVADLHARIPVVRHRFDFFDIDISCDGAPTIASGQSRDITVKIINRSKIQASLKLKWNLPKAVDITPCATGNILSMPKALGKPMEAKFTFSAEEIDTPSVCLGLEVAIDSRPTVMTVPVVLLNGNISQQA